MVKQWKKSLEQSDILSDGTPFDGSNIDAPISEAGGGVDWSSKGFDTSVPTTGSHGSDTLINVSGSGYLIGLSTEYDNTFTVQIDGGEIYEYSLENNSQPFFWRFNDSIKVALDITPSPSYPVNLVID